MITAEAMLSLEAIRDGISQIVGHYATRSPIVSAWADDLYIRLTLDADSVTLSEIKLAQSVFGFEGEPWMEPADADVQIRELCRKLGRSVVLAVAA